MSYPTGQGPSNGPSSGPPLSQEQDRQWASLANLGGILSFPPSLIIWLVFKDRGPFTNEQGKEALNFQITLLIAEVVSYILIAVFIGALLIPVIYVLRIVFSILAFIKAKDGIAYRYPFALRLIK